MTRIILFSVAAGMISGFTFLPGWYIDISEPVMIVGLSVLLFFVGVELGIEGTAVTMLKDAGIKVLLYPLAIIGGTLASAAIASLLIPVSAREAMAVGSGFGWYTLAPVMLMEYSSEISAMSFMHNVMREFLGLLLIPFVARFIGHIETVSLPGVAAMDVFLPIVEKATSKEILVYSFVVGLVMAVAVPILVPFFAGI